MFTLTEYKDGRWLATMKIKELPDRLKIIFENDTLTELKLSYTNGRVDHYSRKP